jgi:hypothetical protein
VARLGEPAQGRTRPKRRPRGGRLRRCSRRARRCGSPSAAYPGYGESRRNMKMHHGGKGDLLHARTRKEGWSREVGTTAGSGEHRRHHRGGHGHFGPHLGETAVPEVCYIEARLTREFVELRAKARRRGRAWWLRQWGAAARWRGAPFPWRSSEMKGARGERELARRLRRGRERP